MRKQILVPLTAGLSAYLATVIGAILYRYGVSRPFCGSLHDFNGDMVPEVCIGFFEYFGMAATHPDFALPGLIAALMAGLATFGWIYRHG